jgi:hypothetical protein
LLLSNHTWQELVRLFLQLLLQTPTHSRTFYASPFFFVNNLHELAQSLYDFVIICHGPPEHMFVVN